MMKQPNDILRDLVVDLPQAISIVEKADADLATRLQEHLQKVRTLIGPGSGLSVAPEPPDPPTTIGTKIA